MTLFILFFFFSCSTGKKVSDYAGIPYSDVRYAKGAQNIPGKIQCEYYDLGGEGIAYHDTDTINSGSGRLNPLDGSYLHAFRSNEAVDISFTKSRQIDDTDYNRVKPAMDHLYLGWTSPGEWIKYTIDVKKTGRYHLGIQYTAHEDGQISISINDKDVTGPLHIVSTYDQRDTVAWRQWHHWNYLDHIAEIGLQKGRQVLTLHTVANGQMNYDYLNFTAIPGK